MRGPLPVPLERSIERARGRGEHQKAHGQAGLMMLQPKPSRHLRSMRPVAASGRLQQVLWVATGMALANATMLNYSEYVVPIGEDEYLHLLTDAHRATAPLVRPATGGSGSVVLDTMPTDCDPTLDASDDDCDVQQRVAQTGRVVWPSSVLLLHTLRAEFSVGQLSSLRCIELGSGTGVVGLALARWGALSVVLTDLPHMMSTLDANIAANHDVHEKSLSIQSAVLDWNTPREHLAASGLISGPAFDLAVAADVIYSKSAVKPFLTTLRTVFGYSLNRDSQSAKYESAVDKVAYVAMHERGKGYLARYFRVHARRAGFTLQLLDPTLAVQQVTESLESLSDRRQMQLFQHAAQQAVTAANAGNVYVVKLNYKGPEEERGGLEDGGSVVPQTKSWAQDSEMWTDLIELLRMDGGNDNPSAVSLRAAPTTVDSSDGVNASATDQERREARVAARRAARKEAKARHDYWYKHAHPS